MAGLPHYQNSLFGINNYEPVVFRRITCRDCFPTTPIGAMELDYGGTDLYDISLTWAVDYWDDQFS
mgnify:CR=1 FL=1